MTNLIKKSRGDKRMEVVCIIYSFILLREEISPNQIFEETEFDSFQMDIVKKVSQKIDIYNKFIKNFINQNWDINSISPLLKSILYCASVELWTTDMPLVANEYVKICKELMPDDSYKFVNKYIQKLGLIYEKSKQNIKNN